MITEAQAICGFGFTTLLHTELLRQTSSSWDQKNTTTTSEDATINDLSKIASYIPGVSIIVGITRALFVIFAAIDLYEKKQEAGLWRENTKGTALSLVEQSGRVFLEISSLSLLLPVVDLIVTIAQIKALRPEPQFTAVRKS